MYRLLTRFATPPTVMAFHQDVYLTETPDGSQQRWQNKLFLALKTLGESNEGGTDTTHPASGDAHKRGTALKGARWALNPC